MNIRSLVKPLALVAGLCSIAPPSSALMESLSIESLVEHADAVVRGIVEETNAQWNDARTQIVTRAVISISTVFDGKTTESTLIVEYPGGEVGDIGMRVSDGVQMSTGEEVIVFLEAAEDNAPEIYTVVGSSQGKYSIGKDGLIRTGGYSLLNQGGVLYHQISEAALIEAIKKAASR